MKRALIIAAVLMAAFSLGAQSLSDNSFFQQGLDLASQARQAYDEGDYDRAADLAAQAEEYFVQSDAYVARMVALGEAQAAIATAEERIAWAESVEGRIWFPGPLEEADAKLALARQALADENFSLAKEEAQAVLMALGGVHQKFPLPAIFVVRLVPKDRDSLWKIAGLPFIYNDPWQWPKLYAANKNKLQDPENPHLIQPGTKLTIPSMYGEKREGTYDAAQIEFYAPLMKPLK